VLDLNRETESLSSFMRNTSDFLQRLKTTGEPVVLTINGKAELVVQDPAAYQKLIDLARRLEQTEALRQSVEEMRDGKGIPASDVLAEMRQFLTELQRS
jgi:PHD/YefM family antitoxin component YafN of YafNO toxin-antitoxin module